MAVDLAFVICTYNPNVSRLERVVAALVAQTDLDRVSWEIVVVDNRSDPPVDLTVDARHEQRFRIVQEPEPGLTAARLRGLRSTDAGLLIYVDDDNIVDPRYGRTAVDLASEHPDVGVFSSGRILPEYETDPPNDIRHYWPYMALIDLKAPKVATNIGGDCLPIGAGMVVRRSVMQAYAETLERDPSRARIDRDGSSLIAGGDTDIGVVSYNNGMKCGYFPALHVTHVMPAVRLEPDYLRRLVKDVTYSTQLVRSRAEPGNVTPRTVARATIDALKSSVPKGQADVVRRTRGWARLRAMVDVLRAPG